MTINLKHLLVVAVVCTGFGYFAGVSTNDKYIDQMMQGAILIASENKNTIGIDGKPIDLGGGTEVLMKDGPSKQTTEHVFEATNASDKIEQGLTELTVGYSRAKSIFPYDYEVWLHINPETIPPIPAPQHLDGAAYSDTENNKHIPSLENKRTTPESKYHESRYSTLPNGTFRILEQGGFVGQYLELEIDGLAIPIEGTKAGEGRYAVFANRKIADRLARTEIAKRHGQEAAKNAKFVFVWGGQV